MTNTKPDTPLRVLVCEDNPDVSDLIRHILSEDGFDVAVAATAAQARSLLAEWLPDLLLLDLLLADSEPTGWDLLADAHRSPNLPVIVVSGMGRETSRVRALRAGADDFITKPFHVEELQARIEAVLRRSRNTSHRPRLFLDAYRKRAMVDGKPVSLSPKEYRLLHLLASSHGNVVTVSEILFALWPTPSPKVATAQDVQKYIYLLRRKIEKDPSEPRLILNVRGEGYRLA